MFLMRPFVWRTGWKPGGPGILGMSIQGPHQQLHLHCKMQGLAQTGKSQCCPVTQGRAPGDQAPAQTGPWKSPEPIPEPLLQKWQAYAEWGHRAALTAGTENQRAPARGEGKASFLLCIHKQWLPARNENSHICDNREQWSAGYVNDLEREIGTVVQSWCTHFCATGKTCGKCFWSENTAENKTATSEAG